MKEESLIREQCNRNPIGARWSKSATAFPNKADGGTRSQIGIIQANSPIK